jgi:phosphomevalonate kinase
MIPTIIGISGKRGSGKSLLAMNLEGHGFERISLANWLKEFCRKEFKLEFAQVYGNQKEAPTQYTRTNGAPLTGRDIMIRTGVFFRSIDPLWFCKRLESYLENDRCYVVDDIRFKNEIDFLKRHYGARFIRIERSQELNVYKAAMDDLSETELDSYKEWDWHLPAERNITPNDLKAFADFIQVHIL